MNEFEKLGLAPELVQAVADLGFTTPTPVQANTIPALLTGEVKDLISLAQTGTGKTAAFGLPLLHLLDMDVKKTQALIICPTRELGIQVAKDLENYSKNYPNANIAVVYGGSSYDKQIKAIRGGAQIIVATPGRLQDLMERGAVNTDHITRVILDEADEMLNMGFQDDIENILSQLPKKETIWLFSATMPEEVRRIAKKYMSDITEFKSAGINQTAVNIEHIYYLCRPSDKYSALKRVVDFYPNIFGLIFCRTKVETQDIAEQMVRDGYSSAALHGDMSQAEREKVMTRFRERNLQLLIATDVAARGIDVSDISHVIHYSLPDDWEVYTHRSGRTARAGKSGMSIAFVIPKDEHKITLIAKKTKSDFKRMSIPNGDEICGKQLFKIIQQLHDTQVMEEEIAPYLPDIEKQLGDLSREEIIKRFASMEFNMFLNYYKDARDLNVGGDKARQRDGKDGGKREGRSGDGVRLFINVGEMDGANKKSFMAMICEEAEISGTNIGRIDIARTFTHFDVDESVVEKVKDALSNITINGRAIRVDEADSRKDDGGKKHKDKGRRFEVGKRDMKRRY